MFQGLLGGSDGTCHTGGELDTYRVTYIGKVVCSHVSGALDGSDGSIIQYYGTARESNLNFIVTGLPNIR